MFYYAINKVKLIRNARARQFFDFEIIYYPKKSI